MKLLAAILAASVLAGCATHNIKGDIKATYTKHDIAKTQFPPSQEKLEGKAALVLVMDTKIKTKLAKQAELNHLVSANVENLLQQVKVTLADREKAREVSEELKLAEIKGVSTYQGEMVADYIIMPSITNATFSRKFHEAYTTTNKKGEVFYHPARCVYEAETTGVLEVYEMPSLTPLSRLELKGYASQSTETQRYSRCGYSGNDTNALVVDAGKQGIFKQKSAIKNLFAPKGYVVELRINEKGEAIIKSTIGKKQGAIAKGKVFVKQKRAEINDLTGQSEMIEVTVAEGVISDRIHGPYSWIKLNKKKTRLGDIRIGDLVVLEYRDSFMDKASNTLTSFNKFIN